MKRNKIFFNLERKIFKGLKWVFYNGRIYILILMYVHVYIKQMNMTFVITSIYMLYSYGELR